MLAIIILCFVFPGGLARKLTNEEYHLLPPAFHLDHYERCLSQNDGLYCLGTFHLTPEREPNQLYNLMKEYSEDRTFNRTLIRRGYCVSARCPSTERNASLRFERCAQQWGHDRALRTSLKTLHYCRSAEAYRLGVDTLETSYRVVLYAMYAFLTLNLVGTVYDFMSEGNAQRNRQLLFWSARSNWHRLTTVSDQGDTRLLELAPIQGLRIIGMSTMTYVHAAIANFKLYTYNPQFLEERLGTSIGAFLCNSVILVQVFVIISTFLSTYNLILYSQKNALSYKIVPLCIIKRLTRITPLYLLVMGYAMTWWNVGDSPLWSAVIGDESKVCRDKFWYHMFYVSNIVEPNRTCMMQTWFLAADMQLTILTSILVIIMAKFRSRATLILGSMFLATCAFDAVFAYIFEWKPVNQIVTPERLRIMFSDEDPSTFRSASFTRMHLSTWGHLHAAFLGQALAYLHFELQERGFRGSNNKWLAFFHNIGLPVMVTWSLFGHWTREHTSRLVSATYVGLERLAVGVILGNVVFGAINTVEGNLSRFLGWKGWNILGRLSLAVMLIHWCVNMLLVVSRPNLKDTSLLTFAVDAGSTAFFTYLLAVPLTILVEMPVQKTLDYLIFELVLKFK
ncbi:hypothetical protein ABMA27_008613 [Loxostege sticticalis]|uniref:Nose resistant to fluoxetine protein 6 n=1 Tax=Loxostege sticticalis TaxID=481309 RepID=A0ABR3HBZ7_LOXSC